MAPSNNRSNGSSSSSSIRHIIGLPFSRPHLATKKPVSLPLSTGTEQPTPNLGVFSLSLPILGTNPRLKKKSPCNATPRTPDFRKAKIDMHQAEVEATPAATNKYCNGKRSKTDLEGRVECSRPCKRSSNPPFQNFHMPKIGDTDEEKPLPCSHKVLIAQLLDTATRKSMKTTAEKKLYCVHLSEALDADTTAAATSERVAFKARATFVRAETDFEYWTTWNDVNMKVKRYWAEDKTHWGMGRNEWKYRDAKKREEFSREAKGKAEREWREAKAKANRAYAIAEDDQYARQETAKRLKKAANAFHEAQHVVEILRVRAHCAQQEAMKSIGTAVDGDEGLESSGKGSMVQGGVDEGPTRKKRWTGGDGGMRVDEVLGKKGGGGKTRGGKGERGVPGRRGGGHMMSTLAAAATTLEAADIVNKVHQKAREAARVKIKRHQR